MNIKIDKYEKTGKNKYRIYFTNGEIIDTYDNVILSNDLLLKKEINQSLYHKIMSETTIEEHYLSCKKYIEYRLRSTKEIKEYLSKKNVDYDIVNTIIDKLTKNNYLNDDNFCKSFIHDKLKFTNIGSYQIVNELKRNEIDDSIIDKYQYLIDNDIMEERINKIIDKNLKTKKDISKLRNKLYNNLVRLGYPIDLVITILNQRF